MPISSIDDERLEFLLEFSDWIKAWGSGKDCLSSQTARALTHTCTTIVNLIKYMKTNLNVSYILTGKLQTNNLERHLVEYRQMSGGNYNVSVQQILEAEKKLRVSSALALRPDKLGHVVVKDIKDAPRPTPDESCSVCALPEVFSPIAPEVCLYFMRRVVNGVYNWICCA